jgi:putative membrane protein
MIRPMAWAMRLILIGVGRAQVGLAQEPQLADTDQAFIKLAASSGQAEIQLGKPAAERADSSDVRDFAQRLEKDHTQADLELLKILNAQRINVSREMKPYQATAAELTMLRGIEFDRAYLRHMVKDHDEAVAQFAAEANKGRNPELKAYAAEVLPILQEHLQLARDLAAKHE